MFSSFPNAWNLGINRCAESQGFFNRVFFHYIPRYVVICQDGVHFDIFVDTNVVQ